MSDEKPPVNLDKRVLRYNQRQELLREIDTLTVNDRSDDAARQFRTGSAAYDKRMGKRALRKAEKMLNDQGPPELNGEQKNYVVKEEKRLREKISTGMVDKQAMRANPPGTVARHMRWEKANKKDIFRWQNARVLLEPDNDDPDLTNTEILRPEGTRWVANDQYRENYESTFSERKSK